MRDNKSDSTVIPRWKFILRASGFCALISIPLSSLFLVAIYVRPPGLRDAILSFGAFCMYGSIPAGFFGFAAGLFGGGWFSIRRGRIRSTTLLLVEAATVGVALGLLVPPLMAKLEPRDSPPAATPTEFWFCSLVVGCMTAILFALFFRRAILAAPQQPDSHS